MTLPVAEFIRRFLFHVLPSGFHRIRHYGHPAHRFDAVHDQVQQNLRSSGYSLLKVRSIGLLVDPSTDAQEMPVAEIGAVPRGTGKFQRSQAPTPCPRVLA